MFTVGLLKMIMTKSQHHKNVPIVVIIMFLKDIYANCGFPINESNLVPSLSRNRLKSYLSLVMLLSYS